MRTKPRTQVPFTVFGTRSCRTGEPYNGMTVVPGHLALDGVRCRDDDDGDTLQFVAHVMAADYEGAMAEAAELATI